MASKFVWRSTPDSITKKQVSIIACIEVIWSIFLYWLVWYWFDTHLHLLTSLLIAPLLLLRSPESLQESRKIVNFINFQKSLNSGVIVFLIIVAMITLSLICWSCTYWLLEYEKGALFWRSTLIGAGIFTCFVSFFVFVINIINKIKSRIAAVVIGGIVFDSSIVVYTGIAIVSGVVVSFFGVVAGTVALVGAVIGVLTSIVVIAILVGTNLNNWITKLLTLFLAPFVAIGGWLFSIIVRVSATLLHVPAGLSYLAENWKENLFIIDPWHPPVLIPGIKKLSGQELLNNYQFGGVADRVSVVGMLFFIYLPILLYRWSIKSTFWFYWPLLYIQSGQLNKDIEKHYFVNYLKKHPLEQLRLLLALITLVLMFYTSVSKGDFIDIRSTNPGILFPYLLSIDLLAIKPWQWFQLTTALLTIFLWLKVWTVSIELDSAEKYGQKYRWNQVKFIRVVYRLRNITTVSYLIIGAVFTLLFWPEIYHYLPDSWETVLAEFFGTPLPIRWGENSI
ncbi:hypothetical protein SG34_030530 [Thalassomonas viridans]|uniref:Uncharacterized protein n=1 Tax=Thalassomonas viridans TaxID=137584 RepID=A0AAE9Z9N6_9GAMM|nr:hypothetical protein [Thalassomonas viridans]WDE09108.1 hypothetical protein SG34_030530 [Thalassomonas viridans]